MYGTISPISEDFASICIRFCMNQSLCNLTSIKGPAICHQIVVTFCLWSSSCRSHLPQKSPGCPPIRSKPGSSLPCSEPFRIPAPFVWISLCPRTTDMQRTILWYPATRVDLPPAVILFIRAAPQIT